MRLLHQLIVCGRIISLFGLLCQSASALGEISGPDLEFFEKKIRPVLAEHCYECHSDSKQKGGLRLDSRELLLKGGDSGPAAIPGDPAASLLIKAVSWSDPDLQMPPKSRLSEAQIRSLTEWVQRGLPDPRQSNAAPSESPLVRKDHWAYQPITPFDAPEVNLQSWPLNPIDTFILARLERQGLQPAGDARPEEWLRRIYFDLVGFPPPPEKIQAFLADYSPSAEERIVDQLLNSHHFGERWGRHWLDVVRFAESVTLRGFTFKEAWRYRDYVIDAFNHDRPYNQFMKEQVAGDLIPATTLEERQRGRVATTFLVLGNINYEEQDKDQLVMDIVDEQLDTLGKAFLGQTIGCARCHDHKFDPIPTHDYYAMAGILKNTRSVVHANVSNWIEVPLPLPPEEEQRFAASEKRTSELQARIKELKEALNPGTSPASATAVAVASLPGIVIDDLSATRVGEWQESQHHKPYIGKGYLHDQNAGKGAKTLTFLPELKSAGVYEVRLAYTPGDNRASNVPVTILNAAGETVVTVNQRKQPPIAGSWISLGQFKFEAGNQGYVLVSNEGTDGHVIADAVQFLSTELLASSTPTPPATGENQKLTQELKSLEAELRQLNQDQPKRPMVMSVQEQPHISDTYVHIRGSVHNRGPTVPRGFLSVINCQIESTFTTNSSGRLQLGEWLAHPENPLPARVMVNRIWHWLFGVGLVRTTDNFGTTGAEPSHPELLDYLATRFQQENWSTKKLIREIVLSRTYRLSSTAPVQTLSADPANNYFGRANRRRLEAECIRDAMLQAAGRTDWQIGGPNFPRTLPADYDFVHRSERRSVYLPVFRNSLPDLFEVFDFADPSMVTGQRNSSTVAPQALFLLNHPWVREQAAATASRLMAMEGNHPQQIEHLYLLTLGRKPSHTEQQVALSHLSAGATLDTWTDLTHALFASLDFRYLY